MADVHTPQQRSRNMAAIRGRGNKSTEGALVKVFRAEKITGWTRGNNSIVGKPDFIFKKQKVAVFADGCFWHGCSRCRLVPASNAAFWKTKIARNKTRDREVTLALKKQGWKVVRVWEHEIKRSRPAAQKVKAALTV